MYGRTRINLGPIHIEVVAIIVSPGQSQRNEAGVDLDMAEGDQRITKEVRVAKVEEREDPVVHQPSVLRGGIAPHRVAEVAASLILVIGGAHHARGIDDQDLVAGADPTLVKDVDPRHVRDTAEIIVDKALREIDAGLLA